MTQSSATANAGSPRPREGRSARPFDAVFFDLGGTLFSNRAIPKITMPTLMEAGRRLGLDAAPATIGQAFVAASARVHQEFFQRPFYRHRDLMMDGFRAFARALEVEASDDFLTWLYDAQRDVMTRELRARKDCHATLKALRDRGLSLSIVSNIDDDYLEPMVANLGLAPLLDHWSSSEEARSCKPHAAFFEYALAKAGARADRVLFVGDSLVHDVAGARGVGMTSVLIREEGGESHLDDPNAEIRPHYEIAALSELLEIAM